MESTPNDNESPSKRRRFDIPPTPADDNVDRYVASSTTSPLRHDTPNRDPVEDETVECSESQDDLPLTQDPSLHQHSSTTDESSTPVAASAPPPNDTSSTEFTPIIPLNDIPSKNVEIIKEAIADVYGFKDLRPFQIEAINHLAFEESSLVLIRRTADRESLVPFTVSILRGGVTLILVPLHGLGSDQVEEATVPEHGIEAYYIDEHKFNIAKALEERLNAYSEEEADHNSILLFASPNSLREGSSWMKPMSSLATRGLIRTVAIDEAHEVEQSGRSFWKEFVEAAKSLDKMIKSMPHPVPCILMSATFRQSDFDSVTNIFDMSNTAILQGPLA